MRYESNNPGSSPKGVGPYDETPRFRQAGCTTPSTPDDTDSVHAPRGPVRGDADSRAFGRVPLGMGCPVFAVIHRRD